MSSLLVLVIIFISTVLYFWWEGHKGSWGKLAQKYLFENETKNNNKNYKNSVSFVLSKTGWSAVNIEVSDSGLVMEVEPWFRWAYPSVLIPWSAVESIEKDSTFFIKQARLNLIELDDSIKIPSKYFEQCKGEFENYVSNK